jgi:signal transduction histidine kinase
MATLRCSTNSSITHYAGVDYRAFWRAGLQFLPQHQNGHAKQALGGMAKETAHQIGTPLSSLIGWLEIMKADNVDETTVSEIEKDITRLQTITDRFSKIGSEPILELRDIVAETRESYDYLQSRFSKQIDFSFKAPKKPILVSLNPALHSWTIENLVKNAIDAMRGKGKLCGDCG